MHQWLPLDNSSKLFSAIARKSYSTFFRLEAHLANPVYAEGLQKALRDTIARYPLLQMKLRRGVFWYFLEQRDTEAFIEPIEDEPPCEYKPIRGRKKKLWRIKVRERKIAFEISHILTDGIGAMEIFRTLLCRYYEYEKEPLKNWGQVKNTRETPPLEELELSYKKYYRSKSSKKISHPSAFHYPEKRINTYKTTHLTMNTQNLKEAAKKEGTTITGFLIASHLYALQTLYGKYFQKHKKMVRELVLVNLRTFFNSQTLRNFYLFVIPSINFSLGHYDFDEIIRKMHFQLQDLLDPREIQRQFSCYVKEEHKILNKIVPTFIKDVALRCIQFLDGEKKMTGSFSNLGVFTLPEELESCVESVYFYPLPSRFIGRNIALISYKNTTTLTFGRFIETANVEREMAKILIARNVDVLYRST